MTQEAKPLPLNVRQINLLRPAPNVPDGGYAQIDNHHLRKLCDTAMEAHTRAPQALPQPKDVERPEFIEEPTLNAMLTEPIESDLRSAVIKIRQLQAYIESSAQPSPTRQKENGQ